MATMRYTIWWIIFLICSVALSGCSFFADFYVINYTDKPVTAIIQFTLPIDIIDDSERSLSLRYSDTTLSVNDKTRDLLPKKLNYIQTDSNTISIDIPQHSTVLIGGTLNRAIAADSIVFIVNGSTRAYTQETISKHLKKTGGLIPPFHFTYTID